MEARGLGWVLEPRKPDDVTAERRASLFPETPPPAPPDPLVEVARLKRRDALRDAGLAHGVAPAAIQDYLGRMTAERGPSGVDPTAECESDAEAQARIKAEAGHLFASRPTSPRDPW